MLRGHTTCVPLSAARTDVYIVTLPAVFSTSPRVIHYPNNMGVYCRQALLRLPSAAVSHIGGKRSRSG
jgi:hypothetical protein